MLHDHACALAVSFTWLAVCSTTSVPTPAAPPAPVADMHWQQHASSMVRSTTKSSSSNSKMSLGHTNQNDNRTITEAIKLWLANPQVQTCLRKHHMHCAKLLTFPNPDCPCFVQYTAMFYLKKDLAASTRLVMNKEQVSHWISIVFNFPLVDSLHDVSYKWLTPCKTIKVDLICY